MKITPVAAPTQIQQTTTNNTDAKARAVEAFMKGTAVPQQVAEKIVETTVSTAQEHPVSNANQIQPEELSAIKAPTVKVDDPTPTEDTPKEEPKVQAKDPETEKRFQEIARQERILRARAQKQAQEIKAQQEALNAQKAVLDEKEKQYSQGYISKDRLKAETLAILAEQGISYDELTQQLLNHTPMDARVEAQIKRLEDKIAQQAKVIEEGQKQTQEQQTREYKAALRQIEADATELIKSEPETYEAIANIPGMIKEVVDLIERTYREDNVVMSVEEAAHEVEKYLVEKTYDTVSRIEKIKKRLAPAAPVAGEAKQGETKTQAQQADTKQPSTMKTLTNATASTRKLTARERALLAFRGEKIS